MRCPQGLHWIPDKEHCSKCPPGLVYNALYHECQKVDRTTINPGTHHNASASFFGREPDSKTKFLIPVAALIVILLVFQNS